MDKINIHPNDTLYAIYAHLEKEEVVQIGRLGQFSFQPGTYVYVGSAKRNIKARINRHIRKEKKFHWHFDYLRPNVDIINIQTFPGEEGECQLFQRLMKENSGIITIQGFGSSDCHCRAHLFFNGY